MRARFKPTARQREAHTLLRGPATHILLDGGSRSGKTFLLLRSVASRALQAPGSRHAVLRFRFNHLAASIIEDTWPKMLDECFPGVRATLKPNRSWWFDTFPNGSQVWWGGLDEKERVERILGQEHATIYLNECSQLAWGSREVAVTRLAQSVALDPKYGADTLPIRMYYDANPPNKGHWLYRVFHEKRDPETGRMLANPENYAQLSMNPEDNSANLPAAYLAELRALSGRRKRRFYDGQYADANPGALWSEQVFDQWRTVSDLPDMQRIVVGVDPSGAGDVDAQEHDAIGIVVCGLGTDGYGYVLEDLTLAAGPARWGKVVTTAYERHGADLVVAEGNYGGAMVEHVIRTARPGTPYRQVTATRGKVVRAEPIAALYEDGKVRHAGEFRELEDELGAFTTGGYTGEHSPNRADAAIWALSELFPGMVKRDKPKPKRATRPYLHAPQAGWMGA